MKVLYSQIFRFYIPAALIDQILRLFCLNWLILYHYFRLILNLTWLDLFVCFHPAGDEHRVDHYGLRRWRSGSETLVETCYWDIRRGTHTHTHTLLNTHTHTLDAHYNQHLLKCSLLLQILQMFEDNYPEGLKRLFVIKGKVSFQLFSVTVNH